MPIILLKINGADEGNRTLDLTMARLCFTTKPHPQINDTQLTSDDQEIKFKQVVPETGVEPATY